MHTVEELNERLSRPSPGLIEDLAKVSGDIVVLGAAGKLGPSLVQLARRALDEAGSSATVHAVSRFSQPGSEDFFRTVGAEVIKADITDDAALSALPDAENVIFLVGAKFGTQGNEHGTWATNTYLPGRVADRYRGSRMVALSTGNVYPLSPTSSGGPSEIDEVGPVGDYAMSCLGRERILTHFAHLHNSPTALIRLNYAVEMRYGVLVDLVRNIRAGQPVDLTTGYANVVWQGYANEVILRSLLHVDVPPFVLNLTGPETISIRRTAEKIARGLGTEVEFVGEEHDTALLSDATKCHGLFGYPELSVDRVIEHTVEWMEHDQPLLDKPTHFQTRDGRF